MVSRFVSAEEFFLEGGFLFFHFVISNHVIFHFVSFVWMQCTKCQECRKTYYCVVVQGMRWCFCFVSCHKWSILDVQFRVKTIETCSSGASTSGVDNLQGRGACVCVSQPFPQLWESVQEQTTTSASELTRVFSGILRVLLAYVLHSFPSNEDVNLINSTLRLWTSWWSVTKRATRGRAFPQSAVCEETGDRYQPLQEGIVFLYALDFLLRLLFKLSVYVKDWAANCSIDIPREICRAGFSSVSTVSDRLHIVH